MSGKHADLPVAGGAAAVPESMKSLRSALRILMEFTSERAGTTIGELAAATGLGKSHVSKAVAAFVESGLLVQDAKSRTINVGVRAFVLGARFVNHDRLAREAMPVLRDLMRRSGHSTRLSVQDGDRVLYLLGAEGPMFVNTGWRVGTWLPAHATTAGRVLLAFSDPCSTAGLLGSGPLARLTRHTLTDRRALARLLLRVSADGYAIQRDETTQGLGTIGVPIFDAGQALAGALSLAFPSHLVGAADESGLIEQLHSAARMLSQRLGCPVYPFGGCKPVHAAANRTGPKPMTLRGPAR